MQYQSSRPARFVETLSVGSESPFVATAAPPPCEVRPKPSTDPAVTQSDSPLYLLAVLVAARKSGDTVVLLKSGHGEKGVSLRFNKQQLPCFTQWKNTSAEADGYVTGLEPATNYPNLKSFERKQGRVIVLAPGQTYTTRMEIHVHNTAEQVARVEEEIKGIQGSQPPKVHQTAQPKYMPM